MPSYEIVLATVYRFIAAYCADQVISNLKVTCSHDALYFVPRVETDQPKSPLGVVKIKGALDGNGIKPIRAGFTFMLNVLNRNIKSELILFLFTENGAGS